MVKLILILTFILPIMGCCNFSKDTRLDIKGVDVDLVIPPYIIKAKQADLHLYRTVGYKTRR